MQFTFLLATLLIETLSKVVDSVPINVTPSGHLYILLCVSVCVCEREREKSEVMAIWGFHGMKLPFIFTFFGRGEG